MAQDYQHLWKGVTNTTNEAQAVWTLAKILADKEGRAFISRLHKKAVELCVEILDNVSRDLHLPHSAPPQTALSGSYKAWPQTCR